MIGSMRILSRALKLQAMKELSDDTRSVKAASRAFAAVLIATMCAAILAPASLNAQILGRHPLSSQIPAAAARLKPIADMSPSQPMDLTIDLPLRDPEGLRVLLQQLYDPSSPMYHHFLTTAEFTARFGPTEQDYQAVIAFAQSHGLTVSSTHPNRMVVSVKG